MNFRNSKKLILFLFSVLSVLVLLKVLPASFTHAESPPHSSIKERIKNKLMHKSSDGTSKGPGLNLFNRNIASVPSLDISGRKVSIWQSSRLGVSPLVIFSHGFRGCSTQSSSIMTVIANSGFTVVAPNHADASCGQSKPERGKDPRFGHPEEWNEETYKNRRDDIVAVLEGLKVDPVWSKRIDFTKVSLAGHSLGGYTVLALAGAWSSWKMPNIKAVLAWSPYSQPFINQHSIGKIDIPVMFQGGTRDMAITPFIKKTGGAYDQARSPAYFVEFQDAGHFSWTEINRKQRELISNYSISFLKKYVKKHASGVLLRIVRAGTGARGLRAPSQSTRTRIRYSFH